MGLVIAVVVHAANIQDRDGAKILLGLIREKFLRLRLIWADGGYAGKLLQWVSALRHAILSSWRSLNVRIKGKVFMCFHVAGLWNEPLTGWVDIVVYPRTTSI
jgi:hypothetical protein